MLKPKVFFGIPIFRYYEPMSFRSLEEIMVNRRCYEIGGFYELYNESLIERARNNIAKKFLDTQDDYLFFFDSDIVCHTHFAVDMLVESNINLIAGAYVYKGYPVKPAFRLSVNDYDLRDKIKPIEAEYISTGFMLIKRKILQDVWNETDGFPFNVIVKKGELLSEDWSFCDKARNICGQKAWIHPGIELSHLGIYPFGLRDFYRFYLENGKGLTDLNFNKGVEK